MVKGSQVGLSLRSMYQDPEIPMKIETQSDSPTANSVNTIPSIQQNPMKNGYDKKQRLR